MSLRFKDLESYCDSLERTGDVHAILRADYRKGFALAVSDGSVELSVTDDGNQPYRFRTVEMALDELANVPYLSERIIVDRQAWWP
ncbi:hypothetical protein [Burkholderia multivorans]|uniref:hypothetical protein n=1 Tax=Burkholderia multivorans TaxID=87883 RepID=UPI00209CE5B5|nr:hypothetical protein [Burkholderia multivorans]MCO8590380.1 hypothetical protein [Burkholderia multivorans]MCO8632655.1 hypothetical protein [Burkholderia multivorans]MCO8647208.1 hypothetical protein [Burkholderia multivorans]